TLGEIARCNLFTVLLGDHRVTLSNPPRGCDQGACGIKINSFDIGAVQRPGFHGNRDCKDGSILYNQNRWTKVLRSSLSMCRTISVPVARSVWSKEIASSRRSIVTSNDLPEPDCRFSPLVTGIRKRPLISKHLVEYGRCIACREATAPTFIGHSNSA